VYTRRGVAGAQEILVTKASSLCRTPRAHPSSGPKAWLYMLPHPSRIPGIRVYRF